eukprot:CAMPEP_0172054724 /NCGR_PEP_ID=MMETSP1043-20130122/4895_1 /TAXON_ID=464988 /ORGANISM="Hemiselmis andersenii, Strain CCMP441" /LENGTH=65 /DNA_ID=CAMNT_0012714065 /DNA_START=53 /DNA_END=246 /DNA_ORIENTATION=+
MVGGPAAVRRVVCLVLSGAHRTRTRGGSAAAAGRARDLGGPLGPATQAWRVVRQVCEHGGGREAV